MSRHRTVTEQGRPLTQQAGSVITEYPTGVEIVSPSGFGGVPGHTHEPEVTILDQVVLGDDRLPIKNAELIEDPEAHVEQLERAGAAADDEGTTTTTPEPRRVEAKTDEGGTAHASARKMERARTESTPASPTGPTGATGRTGPTAHMGEKYPPASQGAPAKSASKTEAKTKK